MKDKKVFIVVMVVVYAAIAAGLIAFFAGRSGSGKKSRAEKGSPQETVEKFVDAYNGDDIDKMLDYVTDGREEIVRDILGIADEYTNGKITKAMEQMPIASYFSKFIGKDDNLPDITAEYGDTEIDGNKAVVHLKASADKLDLVSIGFRVNLTYDEDKGEWLIDSAELDD